MPFSNAAPTQIPRALPSFPTRIPRALHAVPTPFPGEYKQEGLYIGVPAIINRQGISKIMTLHLNNVDQHKFDRSCETLKEMIDGELEAIINS